MKGKVRKRTSKGDLKREPKWELQKENLKKRTERKPPKGNKSVDCQANTFSSQTFWTSNSGKARSQPASINIYKLEVLIILIDLINSLADSLLAFVL